MQFFRRGIHVSQAVHDVVFDAKMREQSKVLENITHVSLSRRKIKSSFRVKQRLERDNGARVWFGETGNAIKQGSLPCPGRSEDNRDSGRSLKSNVEGKLLPIAREGLADVDGEFHRCGRCHFQEPTARYLRFRPYTKDRMTKEITSRINAVSFALL